MMNFDTIHWVLWAALLLCFIIQMIDYWAFMFKPFRYRKKMQKGKIVFPTAQPPVSVIIYARNEAENLETFLPSILEQNYPEFEVIVVNEDSTDDTEAILSRLKLEYKHLYHTTLPGESRNVSRKKLALTLGIKAAHHEVLAFIEADSHPLDADWLRSSARHFTDDKTVVLGWAYLEKYPSRFVAYDYFVENLRTIASALYGKTYRANGRNMAYRKTTFSQQKALSNYNFIDAGEDDLLIAEMASKKNAAVELSSENRVAVDMESVWMWKEYKLRRAVAYSFYPAYAKNRDWMEQGSAIAFYALWIAAVAFTIPDWIGFGGLMLLFLIRGFTQYRVINRTAKALQTPSFGLTVLLFDFIRPWVNGYFFLYPKMAWKKDNHWTYGKK
ncbi:MAG: glycosyltransferase [Dysgonamonadaceae bacterium]|jgi:cellulose synthase/poly-beta-1,6-N-acetylglucosamine synthase-like glycosyltransferase|nr:glycosyltransferase [Dysgonamonadaceae bacterium]